MIHPSAELELVKLHGLGNDFLVALVESDGTGALSESAESAGPGAAGGLGGPFPHDGAALAKALCDRHTGIGADGLIVGRRGDGGNGRDGAALSFRLWNADGSEAEMSGNGMRCLAHAALDAGWVSEDRPFGVATTVGTKQVTIRRGPDARTTWAEVEMGTVQVRGEEDRCNVGHGQVLIDVGNPHLVVLGPDPATVDVAGLGALLEKTDPAGLNVEFVALGPGPDTVTMRVWERGVGETLACGTGSCAVAAAFHHWGRVGRAVTVHQPGGEVAVTLSEDGTARLAGPSVRIATCQVPR